VTTPLLLLASSFTAAVSAEYLAAFIVNLPVVVPLALGSFSILTAIPWAAARGRLHIPGYVGLAFLTFAIALLVGRVAGVRGITGTNAGIFLSVAFFLLIAAAVGCVLALFFYRHPPEV
jgi:hypothetical protein